MADLTPIYEEVDTYITLAPLAARLRTSSPQPIRDWIAAGCDIQKDILPVMKAKMAKKRDIFSFAFFTADVLKAHDVRVQQDHAEAKKRQAQTPAEKQSQMQRLAWMRKFSPGNFTRFQHELEAYEREHGKVSV